MTGACKSGTVRAMIVSGPAGVGKSYGITSQLQKSSMFENLKGELKWEVVKGATSAIGLYKKLYNYSDAGNVLVFDDCDAVLYDDLSLNILKAALDSGKKRIIQWNTESRVLDREGIPDKFEFEGSVLFVTNVKFDFVKSISEGNDVVWLAEGDAQGINGRYDNEYVFVFEFSEGKILSIAEYNSDLLVATRLYKQKLVADE